MLSKIKNFFWPTKKNKFTPYVLSDGVISLFVLLFLLTKIFFGLEFALLQQSSLFADISAQKIINLTNDIRQEYGLNILNENPLLNEAARNKAYDMIKHGYFSHYSPSGISPWYWIDSAGYNYLYAGENLAMNFVESEEAVKAWFNSSSHRENMLNKNYKDIGIAVIPADFQSEGINRIIVVQLFGSKTSFIAKEDKDLVLPTPLAAKKTVSLPKPEKEILGEEKENKDLSVAATTTLTTPTTIHPEVATTLISPFSSMAVTQVIDKSKADKLNTFIALVLIFIGMTVIFGILTNQRLIQFEFSETLIRAIIIVSIGAAFFNFTLDKFIGKIMIS